MVIEVITMNEIKHDEKVEKNTTNKNEKKKVKWGYLELLKRKWMYPVLYVAIAVTSLSFIWNYQNDKMNTIKENVIKLPYQVNSPPLNIQKDTNSIDVTAKEEKMEWPVIDKSKNMVITPYYNVKAPVESKLNAILDYDDELSPHIGVDFRHKDGDDFEVNAVMSGKIKIVEFNPLTGHTVEIEHNNGLISVYQSLADIQVKQDSLILKGEKIGKAGRNEIEKNQGVHLHFEIRSVDKGTTINPDTIIP
jgi:stage II sporulation protein Q